jgi:hypothetical protein
MASAQLPEVEAWAKSRDVISSVAELFVHLLSPERQRGNARRVFCLLEF